jgi:hypothetical protein
MSAGQAVLTIAIPAAAFEFALVDAACVPYVAE